MRPFFSIGLPTYNRLDYAIRALDSCRAQDFQDFEVIISDDSDLPALGEYVAKLNDPRIRYVHNSPAIGVPKKFDDLAREAKGTWFVILGDDDAFEPTYLSSSKNLLDTHPDAVLLRTRYQAMNHQGQILYTDAAEPEAMSPFEHFASLAKPWDKILTNISGVLCRPQILLDSGGVPTFYKGYWSDTILWLRLGSLGTCLFNPQPLIRLTIHDPGSWSHSHFRPEYHSILESHIAAWNETKKIRQSLSEKTRDSNDRQWLEKGAESFDQLFHEGALIMMDAVFDFLFKNERETAALKKNCSEIIRLLEDGGIRPRPSHKIYHKISALPGPLRFLALKAYQSLNYLRLRVKQSSSAQKTSANTVQLLGSICGAEYALDLASAFLPCLSSGLIPTA